MILQSARDYDTAVCKVCSAAVCKVCHAAVCKVCIVLQPVRSVTLQSVQECDHHVYHVPSPKERPPGRIQYSQIVRHV